MHIEKLQNILDPQAHYVFLDDEGITQAFLLKGVESRVFYVQGNFQSLKSARRKGYFMAADGKGMARFECVCVPHKSGVAFEVDLTSITVINRRNYLRYEFIVGLPIYFKCDGMQVKATVTNISEGGIRLAMDQRLPLHVLYQFTLNLPQKDGPLGFVSDGLVVYSEPEDKPQSFMTGISFVASGFLREEEKSDYLEQKGELINYLEKYQKELFKVPSPVA
jgi:hypothetical protein